MTAPSNCDDPDMGLPDAALPHLMRRILQRHTAAWQERLPELTKPQYAALLVVASHPDVDQATVGELAAIDKATLAGLLGRLEARGLVVRNTDGRDRRRRTLRLTRVGTRLVRRVRPIADEIDAELAAPLTPTERKQLRRLLTKLEP